MIKLIVIAFIVLTVLSIWLGEREDESNHGCERGGIDE